MKASSTYSTDSAGLMGISHISSRIDRLPSVITIWRLVALLSIGGFFELYDLFQTGYISPGLVSDGIFIVNSGGVFGLSDQAAFASVTFLGLFLGAGLLGFTADIWGRRSIFTFSLIWFSIFTVLMGFQTSAAAIIFFRFLAGIGLGVELVTIGAYLTEIIPKHMRSSAFAFSFFIQFLSVPTVALVSWWLVPQKPFGISGWRWVVTSSAFFALFACWLRLKLPESPRWLADKGRLDDADHILKKIEKNCEKDFGRPLDPVVLEVLSVSSPGRFRDVWQAPYNRRAATLIVFHVFQAIGFFGFGNWLPALLSGQGVSTVHSLLYAFVITLAYPIGSLLFIRVTNKLENKWQIVTASLGVIIFGGLFSLQNTALGLIACGVIITLFSSWMTFSFHAYQNELFPTNIRARAVGICYSFSRLSTVFSSLMIGLFMENFGTHGVLFFISASMFVVMIVIGFFGPKTRNLALDKIVQQ